MKIKSEYISQQLADEYYLVPVGESACTFHGIIRSNDTAAFIVNCLKNDTTEDEIIRKMLEEYNVNWDRAAVGVRKIIEQLKEIDALE